MLYCVHIYNHMRRIVGKNKKGKKILINIPSWDSVVPPIGNAGGLDIAISSHSGSAVN